MLYYIEALLMCMLDFAFPKERPLSHMDCSSSDDREEVCPVRSTMYLSSMVMILLYNKLPQFH